jgi:hypothetical protein
MLLRPVRLALGTLLFSVATTPAGSGQPPPMPLRDVLAACGRIAADMPASPFGTTIRRASPEIIRCHEAPLREWERLFPAQSKAELLARAANPRRVRWE